MAAVKGKQKAQEECPICFEFRDDIQQLVHVAGGAGDVSGKRENIQQREIETSIFIILMFVCRTTVLRQISFLCSDRFMCFKDSLTK